MIQIKRRRTGTRTSERLALKAKLFRGFSDPSRIAILEALRAGPLSVTAIVEQTGLSQPNVSNHLCCLSDCGLLSRQQTGRFVFYELSDRRIEKLFKLADELLLDAAKGVYECARYRRKPRAVAARSRGQSKRG